MPGLRLSLRADTRCRTIPKSKSKHAKSKQKGMRKQTKPAIPQNLAPKRKTTRTSTTWKLGPNPPMPSRRQPSQACPGFTAFLRDRKSTRLNSSHLVISYAVFCLKKKKNPKTNYTESKQKKYIKKKQH